MSFKIKNHHLNNPAFVHAVKSLGQQKVSGKVAFILRRLIKQVDMMITKLGSQYKEELFKHIHLDENKQPIPAKCEAGNDIPNSYTFLSDENKEKFETFARHLMLGESESTMNKITIAYLSECKLSATDLELLSPLFEDEDVE